MPSPRFTLVKMLRRSPGLWAEVRSCEAQITDFFVRWASAARSEMEIEH
jgi:hypothetical protein